MWIVTPAGLEYYKQKDLIDTFDSKHGDFQNEIDKIVEDGHVKPDCNNVSHLTDLKIKDNERRGIGSSKFSTHKQQGNTNKQFLLQAGDDNDILNGAALRLAEDASVDTDVDTNIDIDIKFEKDDNGDNDNNDDFYDENEIKTLQDQYMGSNRATERRDAFCTSTRRRKLTLGKRLLFQVDDPHKLHILKHIGIKGVRKTKQVEEKRLSLDEAAQSMVLLLQKQKQMKKMHSEYRFHMFMAKTRVIVYLLSTTSSMIFGYYVLLLFLVLPHIEDELEVVYDYGEFIATRLLLLTNIIVGSYSIVDNFINFKRPNINISISNIICAAMVLINCLDLFVFDHNSDGDCVIASHTVYDLCVLLTYSYIVISIIFKYWSTNEIIRVFRFKFAAVEGLTRMMNSNGVRNDSNSVNDSRLSLVSNESNPSETEPMEIWLNLTCTWIGMKDIGKTSILRTLIKQKYVLTPYFNRLSCVPVIYFHFAGVEGVSVCWCG